MGREEKREGKHTQGASALHLALLPQNRLDDLHRAHDRACMLESKIRAGAEDGGDGLLDEGVGEEHEVRRHFQT